jgi:UDP-N-acetylglucosamine diphosphorylase/glucosamine-1-phosphate N-acetyltransferase
MQAVLLAAGEGTRMRPLTDGTPKPMLPVADRPLVAHVADAAIAAGADELVVVVGYEADAVRDYFGANYGGVPVAFAVQEHQRGTADAVAAAREHLSEEFVVLNGDNLFDQAGIDALFDAGPAVACHRVDDPSNYGVLTTDGDRATGIVEKPDDPPSSLANAGAYAFPAEAREWLSVPESDRGEHEITDVLERVIDAYDVRPVAMTRWLDVGRPWELLGANEWKLADGERRIDGDVAQSADLRGTVVVDAGATVEPGVVVEGPAMIRAGAEVGPNAYLRGATLVGPSAHVGHAVEIKNSVIMAETDVPHLSYVGDSVIGHRSNLGAGTTVANLRHDDADVRVAVKGERVSTGRRKFGVVVGDDVKTGIDVNLNAGVVLSSGTRVAPGETVTRDR